MFTEIIFLSSFAAIALTIMIAGTTIIRARSRVRNIADLPTQRPNSKPSAFWRSLAGSVPTLPGEVDALEQDLKRAGYYGMYAIIEYLATRNALLLLFIIVGGTAAVLVDPTSSLPKGILITTAVVITIAYALPRWLLHNQAKGRVHNIQKGLPDALDMIRMCLTAGLPLRDCLRHISRKIEAFHPQIAVEFEVVRRHSEAESMQKALKEFAKRMNTPDISALSSLVRQTEQAGTQVGAAVVEFADSIRRQYRQRAEESASRTTVKLLFPVILCLAPPVFILLMGPPLLQLKNFVRDAHKPGGVLEQTTESLENNF